MAKKEPVSVSWQIVLSILPYVWIYALYRIEKLLMGLVLAIICTGAAIGIQLLLPFPWGLASSWVFYIIIPIYFVIKWSKQWNEQFAQPTNSE